MSGLFGTKARGLPNSVPALNVQQSSYGIPVTIIYGTNRTSGNMVWYSDFTQTLVSTGGQSGKGGITGGGGKGGGSSEYNYSASFMIGICEGPISGLGQVWASKQTYVNLNALGGNLFTGTLGQSPWGYLTSHHPTQADGYNKLAYVAFANSNLGTSAETPQYSFEVNGLLVIGNGNQDAYADQVISDFIQRSSFPPAYIGSFTNFANYVNSMGFFISPIVDQQRQATDWLKEWMDTLNAEFIWSGGLLSIVPYGDTPVSGNGFSFTPNLTPVYALDDDDVLVKGDEDPVEIDRADLPDAYNRMPIEYVNRADQYNVETYIADDQAAIAQYGVRIGSTLRAHHITDPNVAQVMVYLKLWRSIYIEKGNTYTFKLPWNFILLDPMDIVTITTGTILNEKVVRIKKIEEDEDGTLNFTCEDVPGAIALPALYSTEGTQRFVGNYNATPVPINQPIIFESPLALVQSSDVELNIGVSGNGENWGGCQVWVSTDGVTYQYVTEINGACRQGVLTADLPIYTIPYPGNPIDLTDTLAINMSESMGSFNNAATPNDANSLNTLCYVASSVGGEFICFGQDVLTTEYNYNLTYLNRGCYGSTITDHPVGSQFVRYDQALLTYPINQNYIGATLYFKFPSYNVYGGALQSLADVPEYTYQVTGSALLTPLAGIASLAVNYSNGIAQLNWSPITDIRSPLLYEIRKGSTFASGQPIGRTVAPNFAVYGSDTYWVSPLYLTPLGVAVYSNAPISTVVTEPSLQENIIGTYDEEATGWSGTCTGAAILQGTEIIVNSSPNILASTQLLGILNILSGSYVAEGTYAAPTGHTISSDYVCNARVIVNWIIVGVNATGQGDVTQIGDVVTDADIIDVADQGYVSATPQVRLSQDGTTWGPWQNWTPGVYTFKAIQFQILIYSTNPQVIAVLSDFSYEVDVDDLVQTGSVTTSSTSTVNVTFPNQFNTTPAILCSILNASPGDDYVITSESASGFTIEVLNSGSQVVRTVNWQATAY